MPLDIEGFLDAFDVSKPVGEPFSSSQREIERGKADVDHAHDGSFGKFFSVSPQTLADLCECLSVASQN